jgi:hypothetical protein
MGGGRTPFFTRNEIPGCRYVGLDLSGEELAMAPEGAYDDSKIWQGSSIS